ncbi:hypothetical protein [Qipengyuania sp. DGS5-3]|uniref:hypothetical protein n=1 Tax=Qipengyuania sp. DGS5-3 TaxID=3349632 RepID=UPI0036D289DC
MRKIGLALAGVALAAAPVTAQSIRTAAPTADESEIGGGGAGIFAAAFLAGVAAIAVLAIVNDDDGDDDPVSA